MVIRIYGFSQLFEIASIVLLIDFVNFLGFENKDQYNYFGKNFKCDRVKYRKFKYLISWDNSYIDFFLSLFFILIETYLSAKFSSITSGEIEANLFKYYLKRDYDTHRSYLRQTFE